MGSFRPGGFCRGINVRGVFVQGFFCPRTFLRATKIRHQEVPPGSRLCGRQSLPEHCRTNKSLLNPQIFHQILLYMHCTATARGQAWIMSRRGLILKICKIRLNQFSKFKMYQREHKFLGLITLLISFF